MAHPFLQARHFKPTENRPLDLIVIHTMEAPEKGNTAENVANFFHTTDTAASAHYCIDNNSIVQCVRDKDVAFAAPGANRNGLHFEHAGFARQSAAEWDDPFSVAMLGISAQLAAEKAQEFDIPVRWLSPDDLKASQRGFTSHNNVTLAFKKSTHTDPGKDFPAEKYLGLVRVALGRPTTGEPAHDTHPPLERGSTGAENAVRHLQRLLGGLKVDGDFGAMTEARLKDVQTRAGVAASGKCDAATWTLVHPVLRRGDSGLVVQELQSLLPDLVPDGSFGAKTESAIKKLQRKHKVAEDGIVGPAVWKQLLA